MVPGRPATVNPSKEWVKSRNTNYPLEGVSGDKVRAIIERRVYIGVQSDKIVESLSEKFESMDTKRDSPKQTSVDSF